MKLPSVHNPYLVGKTLHLFEFCIHLFKGSDLESPQLHHLNNFPTGKELDCISPRSSVTQDCQIAHHRALTAFLVRTCSWSMFQFGWQGLFITFQPITCSAPQGPQCCGLPWRVWRASEVMNTGKTRVLRQNRHYASCSKERFRVHTDTTVLVSQDINHSLCRNVTYMEGGKKFLSVQWLGAQVRILA